MRPKEAGKVAIIMAYGKSVSLVLLSMGSLITAITALVWRISG